MTDPTHRGSGDRDVWHTYGGVTRKIADGTVVKLPDGRKVINLGGYLQDLAERFTLRDGTEVTWGQATAEQHRQRAAEQRATERN